MRQSEDWFSNNVESATLTLRTTNKVIDITTSQKLHLQKYHSLPFLKNCREK